MKKKIESIRKFTGAYPEMVGNECINFQKNPCTHFFEHAWTKSCPQTGDRRTDRQTNGQGDN